MDVVAEYRMNLKYPDGEIVPVRLRIGRPRELPSGNWHCDADIEGRLRIHSTANGPLSAGSDAGTAWQALVFALRFLSRLLRSEVRHGGAALYSHGEHPHPLHFDELFPVRREWEHD
jgi:hypothetical protein